MPRIRSSSIKIFVEYFVEYASFDIINFTLNFDNTITSRMLINTICCALLFIR